MSGEVLSVVQAEGRYGGLLNVSSIPYPVSAIIRLQDPDGALAAQSWFGYRCDIGWGFNDASDVDRYSEGEPVFVVGTRVISVEGQVTMELYCASLWDMARLVWVNQSTAAPIIYEPGTGNEATITEALMELLGGSAPTAAVADNGGVFTDETTDAGDRDADDVALLPAVPVVDDAFYYGIATRFNRVTHDISTLGVGTWTITWEYWSGAGWSALSGVVDDTAGFTVGPAKFAAWDIPSDWATLNASSAGPSDAAFPNESLYYVRARVSAFTSVTTQPLARQIRLGMDFAFALDTATANQGEDEKPFIVTDRRADLAEVIEQLMDLTLLGIVLEKDGFHAKFIDNAESPAVYTFDRDASDHVFKEAILDSAEVIPNQIVATNIEPSDPSLTRFSSTADDSSSQTAIGIIPRVVVNPAITSASSDPGAADTIATRYLTRLTRDVNQGEIIAQMECGIEVWDLVRVEDDRSGQNWEGRVTAVFRIFDVSGAKAVYEINLFMGGAEREMVWVPGDAVDFTGIEEASAAFLQRRAEENASALLGTRAELDRIRNIGRGEITPEEEASVEFTQRRS
ncbi:hypothetical protein LCGC14_1585830 [marine sediment metagenome]|uniref:Uncharacterized protein n=1 Tax=marine sediment metagenome TaxID=412755 RepID=A0A0F9J1L0_9ZZZZ